MNAYDLGLKELRPLSNLTRLRLHGTPITDQGLKEVAHLKSRRDLFIQKERFPESAIADWQKALPKCDIN